MVVTHLTALTIIVQFTTVLPDSLLSDQQEQKHTHSLSLLERKNQYPMHTLARTAPPYVDGWNINKFTMQQSTNLLFVTQYGWLHMKTGHKIEWMEVNSNRCYWLYGYMHQQINWLYGWSYYSIGRMLVTCWLYFVSGCWLCVCWGGVCCVVGKKTINYFIRLVAWLKLTWGN